MRIIFMGTPDFAVSTVEALRKAGHEIVLAVTQPDKPKGRGKKMQFPPVKEWALTNDIPVFQPVKIREAEAVEELRRFSPEIIVVAAFGQILPREILEMPAYGCVNVHASLLPRYRGAAPIQWAVINGDAVSGVTTMQMGVGLDDGDMLLKQEVTLDPQETGGSLFDKLAEVGGMLCVETLRRLEQGNITPVPQNEQEATHVGMIRKGMGKLNFSCPAIQLERLVRGLNPWPSAFTSLEGKSMKVWKAAVRERFADEACEADLDLPHAADGTVCRTDESGIWVKTGKDFLVLEEIQIEGKKRMSAVDFLRGHEIPVGTVLGGN